MGGKVGRGPKLWDKILALFMAPQVSHLVTFTSHKLFLFFSSSFNNTSCFLPCNNIESRNWKRPADHLEFLIKTHSVALLFIYYYYFHFVALLLLKPPKKLNQVFHEYITGTLGELCHTSYWKFKMTRKCRLSSITLSSTHTKIGTTQKFHRTNSTWYTHLWTILNFLR